MAAQSRPEHGNRVLSMRCEECLRRAEERDDEESIDDRDPAMSRTEVLGITGWTSRKLWGEIKAGRFPKAVKGSGRGAVWLESDVLAWHDRNAPKPRPKQTQRTVRQYLSLSDALNEIESLIPCRDGRKERLSETLESYIQITSGGLKVEGEHFPCLCATVDIAVDLWLAEMKRNIACAPANAVLYWRCRPIIEEFRGYVNGAGKLFTIYSRLLISAEPVAINNAERLAA